MAEQQEARQGITPDGCGGNVVSTPNPVFIMLPTLAPAKQKIDYEKRWPRRIVVTLSSMQIVMALLAIITQIVGLLATGGHLFRVGAGIWCGVLYGFSGAFGIIAGLKPSAPTIITSMVFSIIAAGFCLPLLVCSAIGTATAEYRYYYYHSDHYGSLALPMFVTQVIISLIQVIAATSLSSLSCRAICSCCTDCSPTKDTGVVYYSSTGANGMNNKTTPQIGYPQLQPGYVTVPISQLQVARETAYLTSTGAAHGDNPPSKTDTPHLEYESAPMLEGKDEEVNGSKYQRFQ